MASFANRAGPPIAGLLVLIALVSVRVMAPDLFDRMRLGVFDSFERLSPRQRTKTPVLVVDIDDESLRRFGQWPWSRTIVADLIRNLQDLGASVVGLDMVFSEPDRTSPSQLVPEWERRFGFRRGDAEVPLPDNDAALAEVFTRGRVVTGFGLLPKRNGAMPSSLVSVATVGSDPLRSISKYQGAIPNLPILEDAAAGHGSLTVAAGTDEIIRRIPLIMGVEERIVPSLSLEMLRVLQDEDTIRVRAEHVNGTLTGYTLRVGDIDIALDTAGAMWLHHPPPLSTPTVPAWKVLQSEDRAALRASMGGAAVLIGTSAVGLVDLRPTPMSAYEPGVDIHAGAIEQILDGRQLTRPAWAAGAESTLAVVLSLAIIGLISIASIRAAALMASVASLTVIVGCFRYFLAPGLLLDPSFISLCLVTVFVSTSLLRYAGNDRAAQRLRTAFTHYLSPELVAALVRQPDRLKLGGESRDMTFLFTDLEGFTSLTEQTGAESLVSLLNDYLDNLCRIAMDHGGTVDKIVGDAMHVMFNAPLDQPDHAARAVACALALDEFAQRFVADQRAAGIPFGVTRIGVNSGRAVVGNFGGSRRFDYTAHGDAINTAARLESANKALGTRICVARSTADQVPDQAFRPIGSLLLKGKTVGVDVYEPIVGAQVSEAVPYSALFARLAGGDETAALDLVRLHGEKPDDPILALYSRRVRAGDYSVRIAA